MDYLKYTMEGLSNIVHNISQNPSEESCNHALDTLVRMITEYNELRMYQIRITDYRKK